MTDRSSAASPAPGGDVPAPAAPPRGRRRRLGRLLGALSALLLLPVLAGGVVLAWAASDGSLPRALQLAQGILPEGQDLGFEGASGSLTAGGTVRELRWTMPGTALSVQGLQLDWRLWDLLDRALHVRTLQADRIHVKLTPRPEPTEPSVPFVMPERLTLPLQITLPLRVGRLEIEAVPDDDKRNEVLAFDEIAAEYRYDHGAHELQVSSLRQGQSRARAALKLGARDLALQARIGAWLSDPVAEVPLRLQALLQAEGTLAGGEAARIDLRLDARERDAEADADALSARSLREFPASGPAETDAHAALQASATLHPWRGQPVQQARVQLAHLNARAFHADAPVTDLHGRIEIAPQAAQGAGSTPASVAWQLAAELQNRAPGPWDTGHLPLSQLLAELQLAPDRWTAETVQAQVGDGRVRLQGHFEPQTQTLDLRGDLRRLPPARIHGALAAKRVPELDGTLAARGRMDRGIDFEVDIAGRGGNTGPRGAAGSRWDVRALQAKGRWSPQLLDLEQVHLDAFQARVDASKLRVALPRAGRIEGVVSASAPGIGLEGDAAMQPARGGGKLALHLASAEQGLAWLRGLPLVGTALPPLVAKGSAQLNVDWQGGWQQWIDGLRRPQAHPELRLDARVRSAGLHLELPPAATDTSGSQAAPTVIDVRRLDASVRGKLGAATLALAGELGARGVHAALDARAQVSSAGTADAPAWNLALQAFSAALTLPEQAQPWRLQLGEALQATAQTGRAMQVRTSAGRATLTPPPNVAAQGEPLALRWEPLHFSQGAGGAVRVQSRGQLSGLVAAWADALLPQRPLASAGVQSSLVLSGDWDLDLGETLRLQAALRRDRGDLRVGDPGAQATASAAPAARGIAAGLRRLELRLRSSGDEVHAELDWDSARAGVIEARAQTRLVRQVDAWALPEDAPLSGRVRARLQDLGVWARLAPAGWRIAGALGADLQLGGSVQAPQLRGPIEIDDLNLRSVLDGVDLNGGRLRAALAGQRIDIQELLLQGGTGSRAYVRGLSGNRTPAPTERGRMVARGFIDWSGAGRDAAGRSGIVLDLSATLERMQVLVRSDRQLSASGELSAALADGGLRVRGDLRIDRASIALPESSAPTLGSDVVVVRGRRPQAEGDGGKPQARGELQTARPMDLALKLDLGRDFALQGYGITTRLEGALEIRNARAGSDPVVVTGEIRTDQGRYRAWGQALNVETGIVMFTGPYANPSLNLLALRPNIDVRAGVRVTGTAQAPRVQLYAEPPLPDAETLSWVVTGRAPGAGGGGNMQQAALAFLAGRAGNSLAQGLGFDEVGLSEGGVSIGKRLSDHLYVTYEAGLSGAASTLYVFYDITRRLTARGQTGQTSALDLIYTLSYD